MGPLRIVSMLPSATEMIFAMGLGGRLAAVSHECDYPAAARRKPKVVFDRFPTKGVPGAEIDRRVARALRNKESLYAIDPDVLRAARPDVIVTQELCDVCAITGTDLQAALRKLKLSPRIITQVSWPSGCVWAGTSCPGRTPQTAILVLSVIEISLTVAF